MPLERAALRAAAAAAMPLDGADVVDLAAGTGAMGAALLARGGRLGSLTLVDGSPAMLARARRRLRRATPAPRLMPADVRCVPLPGASADVVTLAFLLHLMGPADRARVLAEARRLARPGGRVVVVVHGAPSGRAGAAYRAAWRLVGRMARGAVVGGGPMTDPAREVRAAGLAVAVDRRVPGPYWGHVVMGRAPR